MEKIELKRCPFCGGEAELQEGNVYMSRCIRARCKNGCVSTKPILIDHPRMTFDGLDESTRYTEEQAKQEAAKIWNRRTTKEQIEGEWISVDERLPEESCECLTADKLGVVMQVSYSDRYRAFNASDDDDGDKWKFNNITHWRPLPKPPKMKGGTE